MYYASEQFDQYRISLEIGHDPHFFTQKNCLDYMDVHADLSLRFSDTARHILGGSKRCLLIQGCHSQGKISGK